MFFKTTPVRSPQNWVTSHNTPKKCHKFGMKCLLTPIFLHISPTFRICPSLFRKNTRAHPVKRAFSPDKGDLLGCPSLFFLPPCASMEDACHPAPATLMNLPFNRPCAVILCSLFHGCLRPLPDSPNHPLDLPFCRSPRLNLIIGTLFLIIWNRFPLNNIYTPWGC